jgi:hypothetical protein
MPVMKDLHSLESEGVDLGPQYGVRKVRTMFVLGDNLGSHMIGGFLESFSGNYFCRFCLATRDCLMCSNEGAIQAVQEKFQWRTADKYDRAVKIMHEKNAENFEGVKSISVFNSLYEFHVCDPRLPPCLGHDLFEGIVPCDLTLYLSYLTKDKGWFSVEYLNRRIDNFKLKGTDAKDKPPVVNTQTGKVSGHAVQIWILLRFMPLLIGHKIQDTTDSIWQLILLLREMVEFICAVTMSDERVALMKDRIEDYIKRRMMCFPQCKLKPKHHFILHYPELTLQCGPLIRLWTLRFESKHSYFKKCARSAQNFKNITKTLSEKHQLLQAFYSTGSLFGEHVEVNGAVPFHANLCNKNVLDSIQNCNELLDSSSKQVCESASVNNILYDKGMHVFVCRDEDQLMSGEIKMILIQNTTEAFFVLELKNTRYVANLGLLEVVDSRHDIWKCIAAEDLMDLVPLNVYTIGLTKYLVLHHAV